VPGFAVLGDQPFVIVLTIGGRLLFPDLLCRR
jgi:hypothetical protein